MNNKIYIGSTKDYDRRVKLHKWSLVNNKHYNRHLQNSWNKYKEESFQFIIIEIINNIESIIDREQFWIDKVEAYSPKSGYNIRKKADSNEGIKWSEESRKNLSKLFKSKGRNGVKNYFYGKRHTEETKEKLREFHKHKIPTSAQLKNLEKGRGKAYFTEETYNKLRKANQGEGSKTSKLKTEDVISILKLIKNGTKYEEIKDTYNISLSQISRIKYGIRWGHLKDEFPELYE